MEYNFNKLTSWWVQTKFLGFNDQYFDHDASGQYNSYIVWNMVDSFKDVNSFIKLVIILYNWLTVWNIQKQISNLFCIYFMLW